MENNNIYKLVGIINTYGICPDFVYPIFKKNNTYYLQHSENNIIDCFREVSKERISMIHFLNTTSDKNMYVKNEYLIGDKPIFAFQINKNNIFISNINNFIEFIKNFETDDHILTEQIDDFLDKANSSKRKIKKKEKIHE